MSPNAREGLLILGLILLFCLLLVGIHASLSYVLSAAHRIM